MTETVETPVSKDIVGGNRKFRSEGDFVNQLLDEVGGPSKDIEKIRDLANENGLYDASITYVNKGIERMSLGNRLRAAALRRHGLMVNGEFRDAPAEFIGDRPRTENEVGEKVAKTVNASTNGTEH